MKWSNQLVILKKRLWQNKFMGLSLIVMFTIALVLIFAAVQQLQVGNYLIYLTKDFFKGQENVYNIRLADLDLDVITEQNIKKFVGELKQMDEIHISGRFYSMTTIFAELMENEEFIGKNAELLDWQYDDPAIYIDSYFMNKELLPVFGIEYDETACNDTQVPVLLGTGYQGLLEVGDVYTDYQAECEYKIVGVLPEGFRMPPTLLLNSGELYTDLTNMLLVIDDGKTDPYDLNIMVYTNSVYAVTDGKLQTEDAIWALAEKYNLHMQMDTIEGWIDTYKDENNEYFTYNSLFAGIAVIASFIAMIAASVIQIILNKRMYGIFYANGVSRRDVVSLIAMENGLKQLISFGIAMLITYHQVKQNVLFYPEEYMSIFKTQVIWRVFVVLVLLWICSTAVPSFILSRLKTTELLGGNEL